GRTVHSPAYLQIAMRVERMQAGEFLGQVIGIAHLSNTDIHIHHGLSCDDVAAGSPGDHARIYRNPTGEVGEFDDLQDLAREFDNSAASFVKIYPGVRSQPMHANLVIPYAFACGLE